MRILICYPHIAHYREPIFTELLEKSSFDYEIIADNIACLTKALKTIKTSDKPGWKWRRINTYGVNIRNHEIIWQPGLIKAVLQGQFDSIILLGDPHFISNWVVLLICKIKKIPCLNWGIGIMRPEYGLKWLLRRYFLKLFSGHLLYGHWAKKHLVSKGFDVRKIWVVYNSLDYQKMRSLRNCIEKEKINAVRKILTGNISTPIIFHSGRLVQRKKINFIIDAVELLKRQNYEVHLLVVGDGPEMANLQKHCANKDVKDQIHFFGSCYDELTLALLMRSCDVSVTAGQLGLFAIQSLTYGLPVITHDNRERISGPESESILHNQTGFIFEQNNLESLVDCLSTVLFPRFDKNYYRDACLAMVKHYYNPQNQAAIINEAVTSTSKN